MDIHHLKVFSAVYKHRSFSRAADELLLTQPTVSDHIRALEEELNCKLFDRLPRMILPTSEAEVLIDRAQEIIERAEDLKGVLSEFRKDLAGHLIIGASTIPGTYILPGLTASFRRENPSVFFEIIVSDSRAVIDKVAGHDLLIGIVGAKLDARQVHYEPFLDDELIAITSGTFDGKKSIGIREIANSPIVMREQGSGTRKEFEKILEREGSDPGQLNIVGIFGSTDAIKQAVKEGMGISIISRRSVKDELRCGMLREIKINDADMRRQFYIITHRKRTLPHLYKIFLEYLRSNR
ncbi:MAG: LysR family transcriptional regulator [Nitrospirae bacterium]|nr:LysR family transcriptional regulator [Nitrospirota bacterium]